jgi:hypothetical protein
VPSFRFLTKSRRIARFLSQPAILWAITTSISTLFVSKIKLSLPPLRPLDSHPFHQLTGETHLRKHHVGSAIALEDGKDFHPIFKAIEPKKEG